MPGPIVGRFASADDRSLAFRNLLRNYVLSIPCSQSVAAELKTKGYDIDPDQDLKFGELRCWHCLDKKLQEKLQKHTPLFFYLMREAGIVGNGNKLGPIGSAILLEVFCSMLVRYAENR